VVKEPEKKRPDGRLFCDQILHFQAGSRCWKCRFRSDLQAALAQNRPDAEQQFAALFNQAKASIRQLDPKTADAITPQRITDIAGQFAEYENLFSRLTQLKTQQWLNRTSFDSNYQVLASSLFFSPDASTLYKPLFTVNRFQESYFLGRSEVRYGSLTLAFDSLWCAASVNPCCATMPACTAMPNATWRCCAGISRWKLNCAI